MEEMSSGLDASENNTYILRAVSPDENQCRYWCDYMHLSRVGKVLCCLEGCIGEADPFLQAQILVDREGSGPPPFTSRNLTGADDARHAFPSRSQPAQRLSASLLSLFRID